jgi:tetratricopeptide (TPR) repeat protein
MLNNLAELYQALGRYAEAEPLFKRSLAIYEMSLGASASLRGHNAE